MKLLQSLGDADASPLTCDKMSECALQTLKPTNVEMRQVLFSVTPCADQNLTGLIRDCRPTPRYFGTFATMWWPSMHRTLALMSLLLPVWPHPWLGLVALCQQSTTWRLGAQWVALHETHLSVCLLCHNVVLYSKTVTAIQIYICILSLSIHPCIFSRPRPGQMSWCRPSSATLPTCKTSPGPPGMWPTTIMT